MGAAVSWLWQMAATTIANHPKVFRLITGSAIGSVVGALTGPISVTFITGAIGFSAVGPVAGTLAAAWQAWIGNVIAGSSFAVLQSAAMGGAVSGIITAASAAGGAVIGAGTGAIADLAANA